jgi:hypothetical protein
VLPIHKEVIEAYYRECGCRTECGAHARPGCQKCSVEFNGTITQVADADPGRRIVVARWSIDLIDRVTVELSRALTPCLESEQGSCLIERTSTEAEAFMGRPLFGAI